MKIYNRKKTLKEINKKTVGVRDLRKSLTRTQKQVVEDEKKYYQMIIALKKARREKGLTQEQLAQKAHLPRTTITKIESGNRNATLQTLMTLAGAMGKRLEVSLT